jgi:hypothetical protein
VCSIDNDADRSGHRARPHDHGHDHKHDHDHSAPVSTVKAEVVSPKTFKAGENAQTVLRLTSKDGKPITPDMLEVAHTEKLHLLIVDNTLSDYHHEHPVAGQKPGEYTFEFSPARVGRIPSGPMSSRRQRASRSTRRRK